MVSLPLTLDELFLWLLKFPKLLLLFLVLLLAARSRFPRAAAPGEAVADRLLTLTMLLPLLL